MAIWNAAAAVGLTASAFVVVAATVVAVRSMRRRSRRSQAAEPVSPAAKPPRTIAGRYRLVRELGRGAMGAVHLADDLRLGRPVALKTLALAPDRGGSADRDDHADVHARFAREAEAARRLEHPDIVHVFDAGEAGGVAYIAMEVVGGTDLVAHTRPGALLPVATVLRIVARVALALDHAHRAGVVHRDVKPGNVMWDAATDAVKVADFGIANVADAERTRTGVLLGTPFYMSPEQLAGGRVDGRSDLFALGVVLFELLTGSLPYRDAGTAELLRQIADEPPPDLGERRAGLPEALAEVVVRALQKRPALRYADGRAFAADLRELACQLETDPAPPPR